MAEPKAPSPALSPRICDAHQHFWLPHRNPYPWLTTNPPPHFRYGDIRQLCRDYMPADFRTDAGDLPITATVHVEAEWLEDDPVGETAWLDGLRQREGLPTVAVTAAPLHRPDIDEILARQAAFPFVRGIRHKPAAADDISPGRALRTRMGDPDWRRGYALLAKHGLSFDLQTPWWHLDEAAGLARDFPATQIILNHTGLPADRSAEGLAGWRRAMERFAREPNVAAKISGLGLPNRPWTIEDNRPVVRDTIAIFGVERCAFASNFPVDSLAGTLRTIFLGFAEIIADFEPAQREALFFGNAARLYRLPAA
jgi:predicted TIM-barrel fold metal-dependent hydrolase